jgi:hypothetical protein
MSVRIASPIGFDFLDPKQPIQLAFSGTTLTSDAGLLPLRQFDEQLQLT